MTQKCWKWVFFFSFSFWIWALNSYINSLDSAVFFFGFKVHRTLVFKSPGNHVTKPLSRPPYRHSKLRVQERLILYFRTTSNIHLWTPPEREAFTYVNPLFFRCTLLQTEWPGWPSTEAVPPQRLQFERVTTAGAHLSPVAHPEAFRIACSHTLVSSSYVSLAHPAQTHENLMSQRSNPLLCNQKEAHQNRLELFWVVGHFMLFQGGKIICKISKICKHFLGNKVGKQDAIKIFSLQPIYDKWTR